ncbi:MAG: metal-dependent hydrolase [Candidatus Aenigmarchaeota archaeon]|nr:metal-dependent hydrolase [Candidatus Aenigmarchaeota archaeon]
MKVKYLGHSCFLIEDLLIDPFISGNPKATVRPEEIKCKIICVTHDHSDHLGDAFEIARANDAVIVAIHEVAVLAQSKGLKAEGMNIGGSIEIGDWKIKMVEAKHSSDKGHPAGFILFNKKFNKTIYHAGDTGLFGDMKLIGDEGIDIALLPIGDRYTMGVDDAVKAVNLIRPKIAVPMHYGTFPVLTGTPDDFKEKSPVRTEIFEIGEEKDL